MTTMLHDQNSPRPEETTLAKAQLDGLLTGNTLYIDLPPGGPGGTNGGVAACYYGADGRAAFKLPTGTTLVGPWQLLDDHYRCDWDNGPKNSCSRLVKSGGKIAIHDAASGQRRADISKIVPGNCEML